jgi:FkbM family methyltransferase
MDIRYALGNVLLAPRKYKNWGEVILSTVKRQEPSKVILKNGLSIEAEMSLRFMVREIFIDRVYNPTYLPINKDDIVVDIGANNGLFTLFAASLTYNKVYAFEPAPRNFEVLQRNIATNKLLHVTAYCSAVSDKVGSATLHLNPADVHQNLLSECIIPAKIAEYKTRTNLHYLIAHAEDAEHSVIVPTTTVQDIIESNHLERIDFLKLDCEGAEGPILQSASRAYLQKVGKVALEFHDHLSEINHQTIQNTLDKAGFMTRLKWNGTSPLGYIYAWRT